MTARVRLLLPRSIASPASSTPASKAPNDGSDSFCASENSRNCAGANSSACRPRTVVVLPNAARVRVERELHRATERGAGEPGDRLVERHDPLRDAQSGWPGRSDRLARVSGRSRPGLSTARSVGGSAPASSCADRRAPRAPPTAGPVAAARRRCCPTSCRSGP